MVTYFVLAQA